MILNIYLMDSENVRYQNNSKNVTMSTISVNMKNHNSIKFIDLAFITYVGMKLLYNTLYKFHSIMSSIKIPSQKTNIPINKIYLVIMFPK